jgi:hypothetical protein
MQVTGEEWHGQSAWDGLLCPDGEVSNCLVIEAFSSWLAMGLTCKHEKTISSIIGQAGKKLVLLRT